MLQFLHGAAGILGRASLVIALFYSASTLTATLVWRLRGLRNLVVDAHQPAVSVLKPLCGVEPDLHANLRSFCRQDYPRYEVIFGVRDPSDPSLPIVARLIAEFPELAISVVINPRLYGNNFKNSNVMNMLEAAQHDILIVADSDARVRPDYLGRVTAPLRLPQVGLVTCIYRGVPSPTIWSRLGTLYVNEWFMPSVLLAWLFGHENYASGQTLCLRRSTLEAIGGLRPIANHLADDYRLGEMVRSLGLKIFLSTYEVEAQHHEPSLESLVSHQLRWMRTLQILRPRSFRFVFLSYSMPLAFLGMLLAPRTASTGGLTWTMFALTLAAQLLLHTLHHRRLDRAWFANLALIPARDLILCWTWLRTFFVSRVIWRGRTFDVDSQGVMHRSA